MNEVAFLIELLVSLRDMVVILFIRRHVDNFVGDARVHRIRLVDLSIRSLNKAVLIDARVACQRVDQTDVRTFRSLNRAHTSIVRIVNVTDFETCTVT